MIHHFSPLRYPGGKSRISGFFEDIILLNNLEGCTFHELYAGGAGASLKLLFSGLCNRIVLNDLDNHIYQLWYSILFHTDDFSRLLIDTIIDVENWKHQKYIYENSEEFSDLEVGFSTFFLNRTNRSGIINKAGPIGGIEQNGNYKLDVRYNKRELLNRIRRIANMKDRIEIHKKESLDMISDLFKNNLDNNLFFLDPPYYKQGESLYLNFYKDKDHMDLNSLLNLNKNKNWVLTYDNTERINQLYSDFRKSFLPMSYTLQNKRKSKEVIIFSDSLSIPKQIRLGREKKHNIEFV